MRVLICDFDLDLDLLGALAGGREMGNQTSAAHDLLEALIMIRDADNDAASDGLPTIPRAARAKIDAAIAKAINEDLQHTKIYKLPKSPKYLTNSTT